MLPADFDAQLPTHLPALHALARRLVGNQDDAEDLVQEALARAAKNLAAFREDSSLKTWLFSITTRLAIDQLRAAKRWDKQVMIDACDEKGAASVSEKFSDPSVAFDVAQHIAFCFTCIGRTLEPEAQAALVLREVMGLENAEAATVLDTTEPKLRHALAAARDTMRAEYDGLCALVNKNGACYQCRALREMAPAGRKGPELPPSPLGFDQRLAVLRAAHAAPGADPRLSEYFFEYTRRTQRR